MSFPHSPHTALTPSQNTLRYESTFDIFNKPTYDNACVFFLMGKPDASGDNPVTVSTWLKCGDGAAEMKQAMKSPSVDDILSFQDDRVGNIVVTFQATESQFPFPGAPIVGNDLWHSRSWGEQIPFQNCQQLSETGQLESEDCKGTPTEANICTSGFVDDVEAVINREDIIKHGWLYAMAFPGTVDDAACPSSKRSLSRFNIEDVD